jgi:hypothetical protein
MEIIFFPGAIFNNKTFIMLMVGEEWYYLFKNSKQRSESFMYSSLQNTKQHFI